MAVALAGTVVVLGSTGVRAAEAPVNLATAAGFSVLAGSHVANINPTVLAQGLGVHPGSAIMGAAPIVGGETHLADAIALQAKSDLDAAYLNAANRTPFTNLPTELGGTTLIPGVYRLGEAQVTNQLTLNAQGDSQSVFIFQVSSTLNTAVNSSVVFINGASPCNVFWQVTSSATLGTGSTFVGNIMALASVTMNSGATLQGRALARTAAVNLNANTISEPVCAAATAGPTASPTGGPTTSPTGGPTASGPGGPTGSAPGGPPTMSTVPASGDAIGSPIQPVTGPPPVAGGSSRLLPTTADGGRLRILLGAGTLMVVLGLVVVASRRRGRVTGNDR